MKNAKRILTLALVLMMIVAMAAPAFADENYYTITITNPNAETSANHTYEAYQIFAGDLSADGTTLSNVVWGNAVDGDKLIAALKGHTFFGEGENNLFSHCTTAAQVADVIASTGFGTNDNVRLFAELVEANLKEGAPHIDSTETTAPYTIKIPKDLDGYYLVKDKDGSQDGKYGDYTKYILRVVDDTTVQHKGSVPTVNKQVSKDKTTGYTDAIDSALATTYYYKLTGTLPSDYRDYFEYTYVFTDTMSAGIDFGAIEEVYIARRGGAHEALTPGVHFTFVETPNADGTTTLKISFADLKADFNGDDTRNDLDLHNEDKIIVVYSATLDKDAVIAGTGNDNSVYLEYSNNPNGEGTGKTKEDETKVYSFAMEVVKVDNANRSLYLDGAQFVLYRSVSTTVEGTETLAQVDEYAIIEDGIVTGWTTDLAQATALTTVDGKFSVAGLAASTYWLKETVAPDGYELLLDPIYVTVSATYTENQVTGMTVVTDAQGGGVADNDNGTVTITVVNHQGNVLPETGGMGTTLFYLAGSIMAVGAGVLLITKKRMGN